MKLNFLLEGGAVASRYVQQVKGVSEEEVPNYILTEITPLFKDIIQNILQYWRQQGIYTDIIGSSLLKYKYAIKDNSIPSLSAFKAEILQQREYISLITQHFIQELQITDPIYLEFVSEMETLFVQHLTKIYNNFTTYKNQILQKDIDIDFGLNEQDIKEELNVFIETKLSSYVEDLNVVLQENYSADVISLQYKVIQPYGAITVWQIEDKYIQLDFLIVPAIAYPYYLSDTIVSTSNFLFTYSLYMGNFDVFIKTPYNRYVINLLNKFREHLLVYIVNFVELLDYKQFKHQILQKGYIIKDFLEKALKFTDLNFKEILKDMETSMRDIIRVVQTEETLMPFRPLGNIDAEYNYYKDDLHEVLLKFIKTYIWGIYYINDYYLKSNEFSVYKYSLYHKIYMTFLVFSYIILVGEHLWITPTTKIKEAHTFNDLYKKIYKEMGLYKVNDFRRSDYNRLLLKIGNKIEKYKKRYKEK